MEKRWTDTVSPAGRSEDTVCPKPRCLEPLEVSWFAPRRNSPVAVAVDQRTGERFVVRGHDPHANTCALSRRITLAKVKKCIHCGSDKLTPGIVITPALGNRMLFRPTATRFLTLKTGINIVARACQNCGAVVLLTNTAELRKMTKPK